MKAALAKIKFLLALLIAIGSSIAHADTMTVHVLDTATKQPLPNVTISLRTQKDTSTFVTDSNGAAQLNFSNSQYLSIGAKLDQYVPATAFWQMYDQQHPTYPKEITITLEKGTTIGGVVRDEEGHPVSGASVNIAFPSHPPEVENGPFLGYEGTAARTNDQGHWQINLAPANLENLSVMVKHPDFASDDQFQLGPPAQQLRDMSAVLTLKKGLAITGHVLDESGKPISGATLTRANENSGGRPAGRVKSNSKGEFTFKNVPPGPTTIVVMAKEHSPDTQAIEVAANMKPVEFKLTEGHLLHGFVNDKDGHPLSNVDMNLSEWRGQNSIPFSIKTGPDGGFMWDSAPADEMHFYIGKEGFRDRNDFKMKAGDDAVTVTLLPPLKIHGTVVDAQSNKPVEKFRLAVQMSESEGILQFGGEPAEPITDSGGKFERTVTDDAFLYRVHIDAEGYEAADSRLIKQTETDVSLDFQLKHAKQLTGTIHNPDGKPAANAQVVLVLPGKNVGLDNGKINTWSLRELPNGRTTADGAFSLSMQSGNFKLLVLDDSGYVELDPKQITPVITLQPGAKITGQLRVGKNPGANMQIHGYYSRIWDSTQPSIYENLGTITDAQGRFILDHVTAGDLLLARGISIDQRRTAYTCSTPVHAEAGKTVDVAIGGRGRPIIGKLEVPESLRDKPYIITQQLLMTKIQEPHTPPDFDKLTPKEKSAWGMNWLKTPEGQAYLKAQSTRRQFLAELKEDHTFRIEDVDPGTYELIFSICQRSSDNRPWGPSLARADKEIIVDPIPGGQSDDPLDVGTISLEPTKK